MRNPLRFARRLQGASRVALFYTQAIFRAENNLQQVARRQLTGGNLHRSLLRFAETTLVLLRLRPNSAAADQLACGVQQDRYRMHLESRHLAPGTINLAGSR